MVTRTWPVLQSFEKDQTRQNFVINQISAGLTELNSTGTGALEAPNTFKGNNTGVAAVPLDLTPAQSIALLGVREPLTANRDYYVLTTGSDSNNGLTNTAGGAFLTVQKALTTAYGLIDLRGFNCTIHVGTGTFNAGSGNNILAPQIGVGIITLSGNGPTNTILTSTGVTLNLVKNAVITLDNLKLDATGGFYCLVAQQSGIILGSALGGSTPNLAFGVAGVAHMYAASYGTIYFYATPYSIDGNATIHMNANGMGYISIAGSGSGAGLNAITINSARAFSNAFANASNLGYIEASFTNYTGAGIAGTTGQKYNAFANSLIATAGAGVMPGNIAGAVSSGGVYY